MYTVREPLIYFVQLYQAVHPSHVKKYEKTKTSNICLKTWMKVGNPKKRVGEKGHIRVILKFGAF